MAFWVVVLVVSGGSKIQVKDSKDGDRTLYIVHDIPLKCDLPHREMEYDDINLNIYKEISKSKNDSTFYLFVFIYSEGGLDIRRGDTLKLDIGGELHYLRCTRLFQEKYLFSRGTTIYGRAYKKYSETPIYNIDRELLRKIAGCKKVPFEFYGRNRHMTGKIPSKGTKLIRKFCDKYVQESK
jgi:hypothetical protein